MTKLTVNEILDFSLKSKTLITFLNELYKDTDKTLALINKANELDCTLLVGLGKYKEVEKMVDDMGIKVRVASCARDAVRPPFQADRYDFNNRLQANVFRNGFIVDDSVDEKTLLTFKNFKFLGGFKQITN